jgi:hypothetical protein
VSGKIVVGVLATAWLAALVAIGGARARAQEPAAQGSPNAPRPQASEAEGPVQPIAFSHKVHAGTLQLPCTFCHVNPNPGELMTFPVTATCMGCHKGIKTESPQIQALAAHDTAGTRVPWVRVYQIASYVNFSHRAHVAAGAACADCHGQVPARDRLYREGDITMGACLNCHRQKSASLDCSYCHQPL